MRQVECARFHDAMRLVGRAAFDAGEFVGQESFMTAGEIGELARPAGIRSGVSVLDPCCGVAGPGRLIAAHLRAARALSFSAYSSVLSRTIGRRALTELFTSQDVWCEWMASGRIRKYAVVAVATGRSGSNDVSGSSS